MAYSTEQQALFVKHLDLVLAANKTTNLTRITDVDSATVLHLEDSLVGVQELNAAPEGKYADLGSGGGFPGIELCIISGRDTTLVESVGKKAALLQEFAAELDISDHLTVFSGRAEELATDNPGVYSVITARALSSLPSLIELASPLLTEGGHLICYKAAEIDEELQQALAIQEKVAMYLLSDRETVLSDGKTKRRILVFEKRGEPTVKLPRRPGMAQKRPYSS